MRISPRLLTLALAAPLALSGPALADTTGESIDKCVAAMEAASGETYSEASYRFKRIRGSSTKKLQFEMRGVDVSDWVTCKVRRGEVTEIEWPETVLANLTPETEDSANNS